MATNVFGRALHPLQCCEQGSCKYYCTAHLKDLKFSSPGDTNSEREILSTVGRLELFVDPLSPLLPRFLRVAEAILNVNTQL